MMAVFVAIIIIVVRVVCLFVCMVGPIPLIKTNNFFLVYYTFFYLSKGVWLGFFLSRLVVIDGGKIQIIKVKF
jgi:small-conductance mechanosensitive channel